MSECIKAKNICLPMHFIKIVKAQSMTIEGLFPAIPNSVSLSKICEKPPKTNKKTKEIPTGKQFQQREKTWQINV